MLDLSQPLVVPELEGVGLSLSAGDLCKHVLVTGGSGAGKSQSVVMPVLRAVLGLRHGSRTARPAVLIIDPKRELGDVVTPHAPDSVALASPEAQAVDLFGGSNREELDAGTVVDRWLAVAGGDWSTSREPFWRIAGRALLVELVGLDLALSKRGLDAADGQLRRAAFWRAIAHDLQTNALATPTQARALLRMRAPVTRYLTLLRLLPRSPGENEPAAGSRVTEVILRHLATFAAGSSAPNVAGLSRMASETSTSLVATAESMVGTLAADRVQSRICFDPLPPARASSRLNMRDAIRNGAVLIYQPQDGGEESACVSRALKVAWYDAVLNGATVDGNGHPARLALLAADEFQRVITTQGVSDAHYVDRARALGGACLFASQSISALRDRLPEGADHALRALLNNIGLRIVMASTDPILPREIESVVPAPPPGLPHLVQARPPSLYVPGQMLFVRHGGYGVGQANLTRAATDSFARHLSDEPVQ